MKVFGWCNCLTDATFPHEDNKKYWLSGQPTGRQVVNTKVLRSERNEAIFILTIGMPIMSISVPDPKFSATVSISPIPAAKASDVDTAGRNFLFWVNSSGDLGKSYPK
jgi:hypothetical protein